MLVHQRVLLWDCRLSPNFWLLVASDPGPGRGPSAADLHHASRCDSHGCHRHPEGETRGRPRRRAGGCQGKRYKRPEAHDFSLFLMLVKSWSHVQAWWITLNYYHSSSRTFQKPTLIITNCWKKTSPRMTMTWMREKKKGFASSISPIQWLVTKFNLF